MNPFITPLSPNYDAAVRDVSSDDPRFRTAAAARLSDPPEGHRVEAQEHLLALLRDPNAHVRQAAVAALGELGAADALTAIEESWSDEHAGVRQAAIVAVAQLAPAQAVRKLAALADDERADVRHTAVMCLGQLGDADAAGALAARLGDDEYDIRFAAAYGLAGLGRDDGAALLIEALSMPTYAFDAAIALGDVGAADAEPELRRIASAWGTPPFLRAATGRALAKLGHAEGVTAIRSVLRSWRVEARDFAIQVTGELGLRELTPEIQRLAKRRGRVDAATLDATMTSLGLPTDN